VVVAGVVLSALTLQPAIVGAVGERLATSRVPWARVRSGDEERRTLVQRWADLVTRHAGIALVLALGVLLVLAVPVVKGDLRLGPLDNSLFPTDSTQYRAWEIETDAFGPGSTDPFLVVVEIPSDDTSAEDEMVTLLQDVQAADGVASVTPPELNSDNSIAVFEVIPSDAAQSEGAADLVSRLRDDTLPDATDGTELTTLVTGTNAVFVDLDDRIADRLPQFIGVVVLIAVLILGLVFRSLAIPLKAAAFSVLTVLATYGVLVAFLTFGWGRSWIGIAADIPVLSLLAPVFFAILFGLSNDYEVYLVTRMQEERQDGADAAEAVRRGLGNGGRIVIVAALIMIIVFASYMFQPGAPVKQFGFGMAAAILLDAFVTRMTLLPAVMRLGGDAMWWPGIRRTRTAPERARAPQ
jgi:RND superfamily putative drug exporter